MKIPPSFVLAVGLLCCPGWLFSQAPANDNFANAQVLAGVSPSVTGNNTNATLETDEPLPGGEGGPSVWYAWTAPASGWHTIHTVSQIPGNGLDTVIALFTGGTSAATAGMLGHNDDSARVPQDYPEAVYPDQSGPSRLVFQAASGTTYRIAVHGYNAATGPFELHIAPDSTPDIIVSSVSFSPDPANITSASADTTASINILTTDPFSDASVTLFRSSNGSELSSAFFSSGDRVSGTPTNGNYEANFTIPRYEAPGQWPVLVDSYSNTTNMSISWSSLGNDLVEDDYLIPQSPSWLVVQNTGSVDTSGPTVSTLTLTPSSADLSAGNAELTLDLGFADDLSGLQYLEIFISNNDFSTQLASSDIAWLEPISGTTNAGSVSLPISLTAGFIPPGTYDIKVVLTDAIGNSRNYGPGEESLPSGSTTTFVNTATAPANNDFANRTILGPVLPANPDGTTHYADLETGESSLGGEAGASVWYEWTAPSTGWVRLASSATGFSEPIFAVFTGANLASLTELGRSDNSASFSGTSGPMVFLATSGTTYHIAVYGFAYGESISTGSFSLSLESITQPAARVTGFNLTPASVDVAGGPQTVTLQVNLETDTAFNAANFIFAYLTPSSNTNNSATVSAYIPHTALVAGTDTSGTYQTTLNMPGWYEPGLWNLVIDVFYDGETTRWSPSGANIIGDKFLIPQSGGQVTLLNSGAIDNDPPALVSLTGLPTFADVTNPVPVTLDITITDDASGLATGQLYISTSTENSLTSYGLGGFGPAQRISGTSLNGVYRVTFDLTDFIDPANYFLELTLEDQSGRIVRYGGALGTTFPPGCTTAITISDGPAGGYLAWASTQNFGPGGLDGMLEDANQDGTDNLLCYAFNLPPYSAFAAPMTAGGVTGLPLITVVGEGANRRLRIEYVQRIGDPGLTYTPQFCSNPASAGPNGWQAATPPTPTPIDTHWERVIIEDSVTGAAGRFARVVVSNSGP